MGAVRFEESDLVQDLLVLAVTEDGHDVVVSVYGGRDSACGTVRFTFSDAGRRGRSLRLVRRWATDDVAVSLLSGGDQLVLFSERAVFDRAIGRTA
ncbi:MAG: hypothetical protein ACLGI3_19135 [Actinomycetes bacterium]